MDKKQFTLAHLAETIRECRAIERTIRTDPPRRSDRLNTVPELEAEKVIEDPQRRGQAHEMLSLVNRLQVGIENDVLEFAIVEQAEGSFIASVFVRWRHVIHKRREKPGFEKAFSPLLKLVVEICDVRLREPNRVHAHWTHVRNVAIQILDRVSTEGAHLGDTQLVRE